MKVKEIIKRLKSERKVGKGQESFPIVIFNRKIARSLQILDIIEKRTKDLKLKMDARKNFIISCIIAVESYFKDIVQTLLEKQKIQEKEKVKELLKGKITLGDVHLLLKENPTLGELIAISHSFENLESINSVLSNILLDKDSGFLEKIETYEAELFKEIQSLYKKEALILKRDFPDWRKDLSEIFRLRHEYIHHMNFNARAGPKPNKVGKLWWNLAAFIYVVDHYIGGVIIEYDIEYDNR